MTLTQKDFEDIEKIVNTSVTKKTKNLPTRDEFFTGMDKVMGELEAIREERTLVGHQVSDHEDRLSKLEPAPLSV